MKTLKLFPLFCLIFFNCTGQDKQKTKNQAINPDENITVNKEFDEHGNLIKYDSIYSYSYSSGNKLNDSIKMQFKKHFNTHSLFNDSFFEDFFQIDSTTGRFNHRNFFFDGFTNQDEEIKSMMKRMDSIQQLFFNQNQRSIIPAEPLKPEQKRI